MPPYPCAMNFCGAKVAQTTETTKQIQDFQFQSFVQREECIEKKWI